MRRFAVRCFLVALLASFLSTPAAAADRVMVGYLATFGSLPVEEVPWSQLTQVCHAFLRVNPEGELVRTDAMPNAALTAEGRKNGVPVLLTIGGGKTVHGLEKVTADEDTLKNFVSQVIEVVADGAYDGVDLGWQFPRNKETGEAHARLVSELRKQLDARAQSTQREKPFLLSALLSPSPFFGEWVDIDAIQSKIDWFGVAAYDLSDRWSRYAAHHTPLFASSDDPEGKTRNVAAAMRYWESRGVAKEKLVLGAPMYGRLMPIGEPHAELDPKLAKQHRALNFSAVRQLAGKGWLAIWDSESRAPWLSKPQEKDPKPPSPLAPIDPDAESDQQLISYDDRNSIDMKANWVKEQGYHGMYFWYLHQDRMPDGHHWLLEAANKAWPKP